MMFTRRRDGSIGVMTRPALCCRSNCERFYRFSNIPVAAEGVIAMQDLTAEQLLSGQVVRSFKAGIIDRPSQYKSHLPATLTQLSWAGGRVGSALYGFGSLCLQIPPPMDNPHRQSRHRSTIYTVKITIDSN
jgi:hypothetical protein